MSNFNVIFWRHAEAEDALGSTQGDETDLRRNLTKQGRRDAAQVAGWIRSQLPKPWTVISSPAQRARQTAQQLNDYAGTDARLRPDASMEELLSIVSEFPRDGGGLILVGHQPTLGRAGLYWITGCDQQFSMRKSGLLWAVERSREVGIKRSLRACISADLLAD